MGENDRNILAGTFGASRGANLDSTVNIRQTTLSSIDSKRK